VLSVTNARSLVSRADERTLRGQIAFYCHNATEAAVSGRERMAARAPPEGP